MADNSRLLARVEERLAAIPVPEPGPVPVLTDAEPSPVLVQIAAHDERRLLAALTGLVRDLAGEVDRLGREVEELRAG